MMFSPILEILEVFLGTKNTSDLNYYKYALEIMDCGDSTRKTVKAAKKAFKKCKKQNSGTLQIPFHQNIDIHRLDETVFGISSSEYLGKIAASLLQVESVRLYQTGLHLKKPNDSNQALKKGNWQRDSSQVPVDTSDFVTFWCPLLPIEYTDSVLEFATGDQMDMSNRHWYTNDPVDLDGYIRARYEVLSHGPFKVGDCSAHSGWIYYRTTPNSGEETREAVTFSYISASARKLHSNKVRLSREVGQEGVMNWKDWLHTIPEFGVIDTAYLPVVYPSEGPVYFDIPKAKEADKKKKKKKEGRIFETHYVRNEDEIFEDDEDWWEHSSSTNTQAFGRKLVEEQNIGDKKAEKKKTSSSEVDETWLDEDDDWFQ